MQESQTITCCNGAFSWTFENFEDYATWTKWTVAWEPGHDMLCLPMRMRASAGGNIGSGATATREQMAWAGRRAIAVWAASGYDVAGAEEALQRMLAARP